METYDSPCGKYKINISPVQDGEVWVRSSATILKNDKPVFTFERNSPYFWFCFNGDLIYFSEWPEHLSALNLKNGNLDIVKLPGISQGAEISEDAKILAVEIKKKDRPQSLIFLDARNANSPTILSEYDEVLYLQTVGWRDGEYFLYSEKETLKSDGRAVTDGMAATIKDWFDEVETEPVEIAVPKKFYELS